MPKLHDNYFQIKKSILQSNLEMRNYFIKLADFEEKDYESFKKHFKGLTPQDFKDQKIPYVLVDEHSNMMILPNPDPSMGA